MRNSKYMILFMFLISFYSLSSITVLISGEHSRFKDQVRSKIIEMLKEKDIQYKEVELKNLRKADVHSYDAFVLLATCRIGNITKKIRKFIDRIPENKRNRVFVYSTAGDPEWQYTDANVQAVTSATKKGEGVIKLIEIEDFLKTLK